MERLRIVGGKKLSGDIKISGAKNAALPILFASLLTDEVSHIRNIPLLADIHTTLKVLEALGLKTNFQADKHLIDIDGSSLNSIEAPYELVRTMRASVLVLGPLLARRREARVSLPGGCAIGARPVDFHLSALEAMGAEFEITSGYIHGVAKNGLKGSQIRFPFPSVGATENILMAAVLAEGNSTLENVAREPEIVDLVLALRSMGAQISGEGSSTLQVSGVKSLKAMDHTVSPDRVEAATYLCAGLATRGKVTVTGIDQSYLESALDILAQMGAKISSTSNSVTAEYVKPLQACDIETKPFPGFPTDMQAQFMALLCLAQGSSKISETIFENRFMHVPELNRLGSTIKVHGNEAVVEGPIEFTGAIVMATDLRASASLIIAGLAAEGETLIRRIYHLDRGYEQIELKLSQLGAEIFREFEK